MGIFERAQTVMNSNFNALLSKFEEPGRDIAYLLSEMKEQILSAQRDLIKLMGESKHQLAKAHEYETAIKLWEKRAELAVRQGDDRLASDALAQKRRILEERQRNVALGADQRQVALGMKVEIERMKQKLVEYGQRQHITETQVTMGRAGGSVEALGQVGAASPFDDLRRLEDSIAKGEAETVAQAELDDLLSRTSLGTRTSNEVDAQFVQLEAKQAKEIDSTLGKVVAEAAAAKDVTTNASITNSGAVEEVASGDDESPPKIRVRVGGLADV